MGGGGPFLSSPAYWIINDRREKTMETKTPKPDDITIDKSIKFEINAGQCTYCGYFKTWDFKVMNPKSKKMMPGHVTVKGFKIDDGDCPYFTAFKKKRSEK
jgi:hypothetical protein